MTRWTPRRFGKPAGTAGETTSPKKRLGGLLTPCRRCEEIARQAGAPYSAAHRRHHVRDGHS